MTQGYGPTPLDVAAQVDPILRREISWAAAAPAAADVGLLRAAAGILAVSDGAGNVTGRLRVGIGSTASPSIQFQGSATTGLYGRAADKITASVSSVDTFEIGVGSVTLVSTGIFAWCSGAIGTAPDVTLGRIAANSLRLGRTDNATPVAQTYTIGESSRAGTDANVGGASGTIVSGLGTGTGAASSLIFQTPTLVGAGNGAQTYATRLTIATAAITATVPYYGPVGSASAVTFGGTDVTLGVYFAANTIYFSSAGTTRMRIDNVGGIPVGVRDGIGFGGNASSSDTGYVRLGAANMRQGLAPSASPINQIFTIGEASRPGTDTDIAGATGSIQSGLGTGAATGSSLLFQTPTPVASGSTVQTYTTRLRINDNNISFASAAKGTTDTTGWLMIPSCAGAPTGVPASIPTGQIAIVYDSTNDKLYFYRAGWKKGQVTAVDVIYA